MALNRWQRMYRRLVFRYPVAARRWRRLIWRSCGWREPGAGCVEPFPRWFGMTRAEEERAVELVKDYEKGVSR